MIGEPLTKIFRVANIKLIGVAQTFDHVSVKHGLPSIARNLNREKSSVAKAMEDILRLELLEEYRFQAKDGGVRRVTLPLVTACKAGASLFSHGPTGKWHAALVLPQAR